MVGRVVGIVASSHNLSAGIGFYAAALSFYERWVARGHDVVFRKDTRIEVTTSTFTPKSVETQNELVMTDLKRWWIKAARPRAVNVSQ